MINVAENVQDGDLVYAWVSPVMEKGNKSKRMDEHEYRFSRPMKDSIKLESIEGGMWCVFPKDLVETWHGNIRKV